MSLVENKKARFDYEIIDSFEAGVVLLGGEVKSIKTRKASLIGSYAKLYNNELWLVGAKIPPYQEKNTPAEYDPERARKLLIHKEEASKLIGKLKTENLTLVPLKMYVKGGKIKIEMGLARGKTRADKRESIKERDILRESKRS